jgi:hypothetical protein
MTEREKIAKLINFNQKLRIVSQDYDMITTIHYAVCRGDEIEIAYQFGQLMVLCKEEHKEIVEALRCVATALIEIIREGK